MKMITDGAWGEGPGVLAYTGCAAQMGRLTLNEVSTIEVKKPTFSRKISGFGRGLSDFLCKSEKVGPVSFWQGH